MKRINLDKDLNDMVRENAEWAWAQTHGKGSPEGERANPEKTDAPVREYLAGEEKLPGEKGGAPDV